MRNGMIKPRAIMPAVYNHCRTGLVDWTSGLTLKIIFMVSNESHLPVGLHVKPPFHTRLSLIAELDCGLDWWTGLLEWITGSNQTASKSDDACVAH